MKTIVLLSLLSFSFNSFAADPATRACRVLDETGAVIVAHESPRCQTEIREMVKKQRCAPGLKLAVTFIAQGSNGKDLKPLTMNITCPRR
ncbi:MAG: hypothetical protein Q8L48_14575 [Archangium sp.]|nr:hypothetical protein [Archangium sp.]